MVTSKGEFEFVDDGLVETVDRAVAKEQARCVKLVKDFFEDLRFDSAWPMMEWLGKRLIQAIEKDENTRKLLNEIDRLKHNNRYLWEIDEENDKLREVLEFISVLKIRTDFPPEVALKEAIRYADEALKGKK